MLCPDLFLYGAVFGGVICVEGRVGAFVIWLREVGDLLCLKVVECCACCCIGGFQNDRFGGYYIWTRFVVGSGW